MDPNENLAEQRRCREQIVQRRARIEERAEQLDVVSEGDAEQLERLNEEEQGHIEDLHERIADLAFSLDVWLSAGGSMPKQWQR